MLKNRKIHTKPRGKVKFKTYNYYKKLPLVISCILFTYYSRYIFCSVEGPILPGWGLQLLDKVLAKGRVQHVQDVPEGCVDDLVVVRKAVELVRLKVEINSVPFTHTMSVGMRVLSSTLQYSTGLNTSFPYIIYMYIYKVVIFIFFVYQIITMDFLLMVLGRTRECS